MMRKDKGIGRGVFAAGLNSRQTSRRPANRVRAAAGAALEQLETRTLLTSVFLQGNYVEIGIHDSGSFGAADNAPAGYHPYPTSGSLGSGKLGFVADSGKDGWAVGTPPQSGDYFVPGAPEEGWALKWNGSTGAVTQGNFGLMGTYQIPKTSLTNTTSGGTQSAVWEGIATNPSNTNEKIKITQTVKLQPNDLFFVINVVLTNVGSAPISTLRYMRNVDPDQEAPLGWGSSTVNYVSYQPGVGGNVSKALVVGKGTHYGLPLGLGTFDSRAVVSTEGFSNRDPDAILDSPVAPTPGAPRTADEAIALAYRLGNLAPGQSTSIDYAYILNEADLDTALGNLAAVTILQPTGTVSGSGVIFQATTNNLANTTGMDFYVDGALVGSDSTPDAGGVFETTFDSTLLTNGSHSLKAVASFTSGPAIEKTTSVGVDNSGAPISMTTPVAGQTFSGSAVPIHVVGLDAEHLPSRVDFFRETAVEGSVFLGEVTGDGPYDSSFSVAGLADGTTVIIKAVATDSLGRQTTVQISGTSQANTAPTPDAGGPYTITEGQPLTLDASGSTDPDAGDTLTYSWDVNGDGTFGDATGVNPTLTWAQLVALGINDGNALAAYDVKVQVADGHGTTPEAATTLTVTNANPAPSIDSVSAPRKEGTQISVTGSATDPAGDQDTLDLAWAVYKDGSGTAFATGSGTGFNFTPTDNGSFRIVLTVTDEDGGSATAEQTITVDNVKPTPVIGTVSSPLQEGTAITVTGSATDPAGANDPLTLTWAVYKNGSATAYATGGGTSITFTPNDNGSYKVVLTADDGDGGSDTASTTLTVANVAPTITPPIGPALGVPGQPLPFAGNFTDPGTLDTFQVSWNFGDGTTVALHPSSDAGATTPIHAYTAPGTYVVTFTVKDKDGDVAVKTQNVVIAKTAVVNGVLYVGGSDTGADYIGISPVSGKVGVFYATAKLDSTYAATRVVVYGNGGDDTLDVSDTFPFDAELWGGAGNDLLRGGLGNDVLMGEDGNDRLDSRAGFDILIGGTGNDVAYGGLDRDLLIGGAGFDSMYGDGGEDMLIAGLCTLENNLPALRDVLNEWKSSRSYAVRTANIRDGSGSGDRVNGSTFMKDGVTLFDDNSPDWLTGGYDQFTDWFFANTATGDKVMDRQSGESIETLFI